MPEPIPPVAFYSVLEDGDELGDDRISSPRAPRDLVSVAAGFMAELCAKDYYENEAGNKAIWPLHVVLYSTECGPAVARFLVVKEDVPTFSAAKVSDG